MPGLDNQLYNASFRNVPFKYTTGTNTAGRKTVTHEFPNKTFRYIEDLGNNLRTFSITGLVHGTDWLQKKAALEKALTTEGIAPLLHPFYGIILCVCTGYTVTDDDKEIGVTHFEMTFDEALPNIFPVNTGDNKSEIIKKTEEAYTKTSEHIKNNFGARNPRNIVDAGDYLKRLAEELRKYQAIANAAFAEKAIFEGFLKQFENESYNFPQFPEELANQLPRLINSFDNMPTTTEDRNNINSQAFGFGEDVTPVNLDSPENIIKDRNRRVINGSTNYLLLANLYSIAILIDYEDEEQLETKITDLEDKYERLVFGRNNSLDDDSLDSLQALRDEWRKFYENLRLTINKVTEIETSRMPLKVLVYQYYGNIDDFETIMQLNNISNPALISGQLKILSR